LIGGYANDSTPRSHSYDASQIVFYGQQAKITPTNFSDNNTNQARQGQYSASRQPGGEQNPTNDTQTDYYQQYPNFYSSDQEHGGM
jgi:hypothetical protein